MNGNQEDLELNQTQTPLVVFLRSYNKNVPAGFPRATAVSLNKFKITHSMLFKRGDMWSIDQHRKRVMDWLSSHREES